MMPAPNNTFFAIFICAMFALLFAAGGVSVYRINAAQETIRQARERARAAEVTARAEHARGYAAGVEAALNQVQGQLGDIATAAETIAAGCVYLPGSERLDVRPTPRRRPK